MRIVLALLACEDFLLMTSFSAANSWPSAGPGHVQHIERGLGRACVNIDPRVYNNNNRHTANIIRKVRDTILVYIINTINRMRVPSRCRRRHPSISVYVAGAAVAPYMYSRADEVVAFKPKCPFITREPDAIIPPVDDVVVDMIRAYILDRTTLDCYK